jgi:hypothetical protein
MRKPARVKAVQRTQVSHVKSFPAPVGGWNARDALAAMKPTDAVTLENWFPGTSYVEMRGGYANHATGMTGSGKTCAVYNGLTGANKMFTATASGVYDTSSAGAVGASVAARTNGKHQWLNYGDGTNNYLIMVNGVDKPLYYDGTNWIAVDAASSPALTGLTTTSIVSVNDFKDRLIFIEKNSLNFWYLASGAAGGALTKFSLNGVAQKGGYLMAMATLTIDAGDGPDDRAVFITSEGEVIIYVGTNPSSATSWAMVGRYALGKPLGRRCFAQYGADLIVLTENGAFPLSQAIQSEAIDFKLALSFKIENAFTAAARSYGSNFGWEAVVYPGHAALIVNIPISEGGEHEQYVMNTITKSWCKFKEWDAEDFCIFNGELYFTTGTKVVKAWTGTIDGTDEIVAYGKTAFSYFGMEGLQKQVKMFRPVLSVNGPLTFLTDLDVDFQDNIIEGVATYTVTSGAQWDVDNWDEGYWASGLEVVKNWTSPNEYQGYCASGKIKVNSNSLMVQWMSNDFMFEVGGAL